VKKRTAPAADAVAKRTTNTVTDAGASAVGEDSDRVADASEQSFPASDPPGWISMWLGAPIGAGEHPVSRPRPDEATSDPTTASASTRAD
jgi:hypothetical protein